MAKSKQNYIGLEVDRYNKKIEELQNYLENNPVDQIFDAKTRIQEIGLQVNIMKELGVMLGHLNILKENKAKQDDLRGGSKSNTLMDDDD
jgi:hypothetical protein